jgi:protoheme IX farnesyltransferase
MSIWRDYLALAKPRVILLHLVTAASAMFLAAKGPPASLTLLFTLLGGALVAAASNALNCYVDRTIDGRMVRTRQRPLPAGRLRPDQSLIFGAATGITGLWVLTRQVSWTAALLAAVALAYYVLVYTIWLKPRTRWSAVIGSGAGAFPPLIGWVAVTGRIEMTPFVLFAIIALWTPAHSWSVAISRSKDYEMAGIGVLPDKNCLWMRVFSVLLVACTIWLAPVARLGPIYLTAAISLGADLLFLTAGFPGKKDSCAAGRLYSFSIIYLLLLFGAMLIDPLVRL